jgi:hypothetical protein
VNLNGLDSSRLNSLNSNGKKLDNNNEYENLQNNKSVLQRASREKIHKMNLPNNNGSNFPDGSTSQYYKKKVMIDEAGMMGQR